MGEFAKHFYIPDGVAINEPGVARSRLPFVDRTDQGEELSESDIKLLRDQFAADMGEVAPDLHSFGLAEHYAHSLFAKLGQDGATTLDQLVAGGADEFHRVGRDVLGPLAVSFVDTVLQDTSGKAVFPARDATPFFHIAKTLTTLNPTRYGVHVEDIQNPVFNRKMWGVEDEQDSENNILQVTDPKVRMLLSQMGFGSDLPKSFVEVGCWGSMIDQLYQAMERGEMPQEDFSVYFLYTHLPEKIYGFTNIHGEGVDGGVLETIADSWEAFPKFFKRPTQLVEDGGIIKASLEGKLIDSPFLPTWSFAALQGVVDAAIHYIESGQEIIPEDEILRLRDLAKIAQSGEFTGVLPGHTETWSEGDTWKRDWRWGKISPLGKEKNYV